MRLIRPSYQIIDHIDGDEIVKNIAEAGRICYKSKSANLCSQNREFVAERIKAGHESILEHEKLTVQFICDRGISHELVRHRLASFSQESTRYCNYSAYKFDGELSFIKPCFRDENGADYHHWRQHMQICENLYLQLIHTGSKPEQARSILPNSLKTEIIVTANMREWRHIFKLRTAKDAHPQMREIMCPLLEELQLLIPVIFDDIKP